MPAQERLDNATARLMIELAFILPRGTDILHHPIAKALTEFKNALIAREKE